MYSALWAVISFYFNWELPSSFIRLTTACLPPDGLPSLDLGVFWNSPRMFWDLRVLDRLRGSVTQFLSPYRTQPSISVFTSSHSGQAYVGHERALRVCGACVFVDVHFRQVHEHAFRVCSACVFVGVQCLWTAVRRVLRTSVSLCSLSQFHRLFTG